jgi:membrane-bound serine protease (ClpP class)
MLAGWLVFAAAACVANPASAQDPAKNGEPAAGRPAEFSRPVVIHFDGMIDGRNGNYFRNRLNRAHRMGADLVIVEIDSPGGYAMESLAIAETLRDVDWAYTVAWIPREAISGAALMALGCDAIAMDQHSRFGDAGPIHFDPELAAFRYVPAKAKSVLVRQARDLADAKHRPAALAEAMVDENAVVFVKKAAEAADVRPEYRVVQLPDPQADPLAEARREGLSLDEWKMVPESGEGRILTLNGVRAVELGMAQFLAEDREALLVKLNAARPAAIWQYGFADSVADWLTHPVITVLLIVIGLIALYLELSAPGIGAGGLIAGLCAVLFFWGRFFGGTADWLEIVLFLAGVTFLLMEVFVLPGFGVAGVAGLGLLVISAVMASQDFVFPETPLQWQQLLRTLLVILGALLVFAVSAAILSRKLGSLPVIGRIALAPPTDRAANEVRDGKETGKPLPSPHPQVSVGDWGTAESLLRPAGRARFHHRSIDVVSDGSFIDPGQQVRIIEISGNRIVVAEIEESG